MKYVFKCDFSGYSRGHKAVAVEASNEDEARNLLKDYEFEVIDVCTTRDDSETDLEDAVLVEVSDEI